MQKERTESAAGVAKAAIEDPFGLPPVDKAPVMAAERASLTDLKEASRDLKEKIIAQKKRNDMPVNSSLGDPEVDARNADGHNDLPDEDEWEAAIDPTVKTIIAGVESEKARAAREFFKAQVATRQALGDLRTTSRELREHIDEANAHIGAPTGHPRVSADKAMPYLHC